MGGFEKFEKISFGYSPMGHKKYDEIEFSHSKMRAIFNLVVKNSLDLIVTQVSQICNMRCNLGFMKCNFKVYEMRNLRILKKYHLHVALWGQKIYIRYCFF
jgi:hypothetical protein